MACSDLSPDDSSVPGEKLERGDPQRSRLVGSRGGRHGGVFPRESEGFICLTHQIEGTLQFITVGLRDRRLLDVRSFHILIFSRYQVVTDKTAIWNGSAAVTRPASPGHNNTRVIFSFYNLWVQRHHTTGNYTSAR